MKRFSVLFALIVFNLAFVLNANSSIVSVTGDSSSIGTLPAIISPPSDILDDYVVNTGMQGFNEAQHVRTTVAHNLDGGNSIPEGTLVGSHMIFLNSQGNTRITHFNVVWEFDFPILGVMSNENGSFEANSTFELGNPLTNYLQIPGSDKGQGAPFANRGLEAIGNPAIEDGYLISADRLSITVGMRIREPGDWIRVVTNPVPIPGSVLLLSSGLIGIASLRRKLKKN